MKNIIQAAINVNNIKNHIKDMENIIITAQEAKNISMRCLIKTNNLNIIFQRIKVKSHLLTQTADAFITIPTKEMDLSAEEIEFLRELGYAVILNKQGDTWIIQW